MTVHIARIQDQQLDVSAHLTAVDTPDTGATTIFLGRVRDHDPGAAGVVVALEYTAHPDAEAVLQQIAARVSGQVAVAVSHRTGRLEVGDVAVVVAVGAAHRDTAFVACRELIEAIKAELPVWKRQFEADGSASWIGISE